MPNTYVYAFCDLLLLSSCVPSVLTLHKEQALGIKQCGSKGVDEVAHYRNLAAPPAP